MNKISFNIKNCYGIASLKGEIEFSAKKDKRIAIIYAPNGTMKSSFAKTLNNLENGTLSERNVFGDIPEVQIKFDNDQILDSE